MGDWRRARRVGSGQRLLLLGLLVGALSATGDMPFARSGAPTVRPTPALKVAPTPPSAQPSIPRLSAGIVVEQTLSHGQPHTGSFQREGYSSPSGAHMTYYLYIPRSYTPRRSYPLVVLLHGGGEAANAAHSPAQNAGLLLSQPYVRAWESATVQQRWPSFIVVPQLVAPNRWVDVPASTGSYSLAIVPNESLLLAHNIVLALEQLYPAINPRRVYLTGLSMGGYGAWEMAERWPGMFGAVVPIAGAGDPSQVQILVHMPIWVFHGADDSVVPVAGSRDMIRALRAAGGHPHYTEFAGAGHEIWLRAYSDRSVLAWLFAQEITPPSHLRPVNSNP